MLCNSAVQNSTHFSGEARTCLAATGHLDIPTLAPRSRRLWSGLSRSGDIDRHGQASSELLSGLHRLSPQLHIPSPLVAKMLYGCWRDAIFEMLMQPATAPGLLDLSQWYVTNDTSCFYGGIFTNERICEAQGRAVESASPHTFVSVRPGSLALAMLTAGP